jgi:hypothetical protein
MIIPFMLALGGVAGCVDVLIGRCIAAGVLCAFVAAINVIAFPAVWLMAVEWVAGLLGYAGARLFGLAFSKLWKM